MTVNTVTMASQARQQYDSQGFVYIPGALSEEEVQRVGTALDRAAENEALYEILGQDEVFVDMGDHPAIFPIVRAVVGEDVQLRYAWGGVRQAMSDSGGGWPSILYAFDSAASKVGVMPAHTPCSALNASRTLNM